MINKIKEKLIGVVVTLITALICFYFASFASNSRVDIVEAKIVRNEERIKVLRIFENRTQNMLCRFAGKILKPDDAYEVCKIPKTP